MDCASHVFVVLKSLKIQRAKLYSAPKVANCRSVTVEEARNLNMRDRIAPSALPDCTQSSTSATNAPKTRIEIVVVIVAATGALRARDWLCAVQTVKMGSSKFLHRFDGKCVRSSIGKTKTVDGSEYMNLTRRTRPNKDSAWYLCLPLSVRVPQNCNKRPAGNFAGDSKMYEICPERQCNNEIRSLCCNFIWNEGMVDVFIS